MRRHSLRSALAIRFALLVLAAIALISIISNIMINREFEEYVKEQQRLEASGARKEKEAALRSSCPKLPECEMNHGSIFIINAAVVFK